MANNGIMTPTLVGVKRRSVWDTFYRFAFRISLAFHTQIETFNIFMCLFIIVFGACILGFRLLKILTRTYMFEACVGHTI